MSEGFTGISFPFRFNSNGKVATSTTSPDDFSHLEESIRQLILTTKGERINEEGFGTDIDTNLFEAVDDISNLSLLKYYIEDAVNSYDDRLSITDISFDSKETTIIAILTVFVEKYLSSFTMKLEFNKVGDF